MAKYLLLRRGEFVQGQAPGPGGEPIQEWIEVRPFLELTPTVTD